MIRQAIVRPPPSTYAGGLTTSSLGAPRLAIARRQHAAYCDALSACGVTVSHLAADARFPDSTFVEDTAVLTRRAAILTRPGAESRRGEVAAIRDAIVRDFSVVHEITPPGTLDGGDVCEAGDHFFIGISARTNEEGARQLAELVAREGYGATVLDVRGIPGLLHLKSGLSYLGNGRFLAWDALAQHEALAPLELLRVPPREEYAANCVRVNDRVLVPSGHPATRSTLASYGYRPLALDMSEFEKMDGGLSCLSLRF